MIRTCMFVGLTMLIFVITVLQCAAAPLPVLRLDRPVVDGGQLSADVLPESMFVRGFDGGTLAGIELLDQRAEVIFDD